MLLSGWREPRELAAPLSRLVVALGAVLCLQHSTRFSRFVLWPAHSARSVQRLQGSARPQPLCCGLIHSLRRCLAAVRCGSFQSVTLRLSCDDPALQCASRTVHHRMASHSQTRRAVQSVLGLTAKPQRKERASADAVHKAAVGQSGSSLSTEYKVFARLEAVPLPGVVLEQCCRSDLAHSDA